jgi:hypothetical protein
MRLFKVGNARLAMAVGVALAITAAVHARSQQRLESVDPLIESLDADIVSVVTGGSWELGDRHGTIRLVVVTRGFDHLVSRLYVQWLEDATATAPSKVLRTVSPKETPSGLWTLHEPRFELVQRQWQASLEGTDTHTSPPRRGRWMLTFGGPGDVKVQSR